MRFVSLTVTAHTIEREKRMSKRRMLRLDGFVRPVTGDWEGIAESVGFWDLRKS